MTRAPTRSAAPPRIRRWSARAAATLSALAVAGCGATPGEPAAREPAGREELRPINGTELFVARLGAGEPILVVHGGPVFEHGYLRPHLAPLADSYELVFYDQRLCGRSAAEVDPQSVRIGAFVDDIEALRVALGLGRVHLMAHSWGGLLAMHYALRYGQNLRSLVLLDSIAASSELGHEEDKVMAERITEDDRLARQAILATEAFQERRPDAIEQLILLSCKPQFHDPARLADLHIYVPADYPDRSRRFAAMAVDLESFDLRDELARVAVPTLILYGADEPAVGLGGAALHARLPRSELVTIADAGHFPFIEQPAAFLREVRRFLAGVDSERD